MLAGSPLLWATSALADEPATFKYRLQPVDGLGAFQRADMRTDYQRRAQKTIQEVSRVIAGGEDHWGPMTAPMSQAAILMHAEQAVHAS